MPTPFDHIPHSIRYFTMVRSRWPGSIQHGVRCCNPGHLRERWSPRKNLPRVSKLNDNIQRSPLVPPRPQLRKHTYRQPLWSVWSPSVPWTSPAKSTSLYNHEKDDWCRSYPPPSESWSRKEWSRCQGLRSEQCHLRRPRCLPKT